MAVLFVCTGNTCRSPMAEALLRWRAPADWRIGSAGIRAWPGASATPEAQAVVAARGASLEGHQARLVTAALVADANVVIGLTREHAAWLRSRFPEHAGRIFSLGEWAGQPETDVEDPIGQPEAVYRRIADRIGELLEAGWPRLAGIG